MPVPVLITSPVPLITPENVHPQHEARLRELVAHVDQHGRERGQRNQVQDVGHREYGNGDVPDGNAIGRNNTGCYPGPGTGNTLMNVFAPNSTLTNNVTLTGAAATTGVCAR